MVAPTHAIDEPGAIAGKTFDVEVVAKTAGAAIAKGAVVELVRGTPNAYRTAVAGSTTSHYGVAKLPALAADPFVEIIASGPATVVADGVIREGDYVMVSGTTPGRVVAADPDTVSAFSIVGRYMGKAGANVRNGMPVPDAAAGDVIIVDINKRTS